MKNFTTRNDILQEKKMTEKKLDEMVEKMVKVVDINNQTAIGILHKITKYVVIIHNEEYPVMINNGYLLECFDRQIIYRKTHIKKCIEHKSLKLSLNQLI